MEAIGTTKAGELISDIRTRFLDLTERQYPSKLIIRDINRIISSMQAESDFDPEDYTTQWTITDTSDTILLSTIDSNYKSLKQITSIVSLDDREPTKTTRCINVPESEFYTQKEYGGGSIYNDNIIWFRKNYTLYFHKGINVSSYFRRIINLNRLPMLCIDIDSIIDLKDDKITILENMIESRIMKRGFTQDQITKSNITKVQETTSKNISKEK